MSQTSSWFSPHNHQRVLLNGQLDRPFRIRKMGGKGRVSFVLDRPFRIWKMGGKGRVSFVPSSPSPLLYKGEPRPCFKLLRYCPIRTLKKPSLSLFSPPFSSLTNFRWPSTTLFLLLLLPVVSASPPFSYKF